VEDFIGAYKKQILMYGEPFNEFYSAKNFPSGWDTMRWNKSADLGFDNQ